MAAFWGGSFVAIKYVVGALPPLFGAALRVGLALAILGAWFKASGHGLDVPPRTRRRMWLAGVFAQGLPFSLLFWGERTVAPGLAGILNGTVPLWAFALGPAFGEKEPFSKRKLAGLLLGLAGIAVIFRPMITFSGTGPELRGMAAILLMALSYAVGSLLSRHLLTGRDKADFRANVFHQHCASLVFLAGASAACERWPWGKLASSAAALGSIVYLGVFSTALAWLIYYHLIREWGAVRASAVTYVAPIFALLWDFVFFSNAPRLEELLGVAAIFSGILLIRR